jgi:hypothetical protein
MDVGVIRDAGDVAHEDRCAGTGAQRQVVEVCHARDHRVGRGEVRGVAHADVARRQGEVAAGYGGGDLVGRHVVGAHPVGVDVRHDRADFAARRRRRRGARERREHRSYAVDREILELGLAARFTREDQLADGHGIHVDAQYVRRKGARRHERARAVRQRGNRRHGLRHVGARMKVDLEHRHTLDRLRLDVLDPGDV